MTSGDWHEEHHQSDDLHGIEPAEAGMADGGEGASDPDHPVHVAHRLKKAPTAFRTISEVADELHIPQHVLRFWETRFPQVKPLKRGGGRRYYRPDDIALLRRISGLLYVQGYTIKGVQRLLREGGDPSEEPHQADQPPSEEFAEEPAYVQAEVADPVEIQEAVGAPPESEGHEPPPEAPPATPGDIEAERPGDPDALAPREAVEAAALNAALDDGTRDDAGARPPAHIEAELVAILAELEALRDSLPV